MLDTPVVGFSWLDLYLFFRMLLAGTLASSCFQAVDRVFNVFFSTVSRVEAKEEPFPFSNANNIRSNRSRLPTPTPMIVSCRVCANANIAPSNRSPMLSWRRSPIRLPSDAWPFSRILQKSRTARLMSASPRNVSTSSARCVVTLKRNIPVQVRYKEKRKLYFLGEASDALSTLAPKPSPKPVAPPAATTSPNRIQVLDQDVLAAPRTNHVVLDDRTGSLFTYASTLAEPHLSQPHPPVPKQRVFKVLQWLEARVQHWGWYQRWLAVTAVRKTRSLFSHYPVLMWATQCKKDRTHTDIKHINT